MSNKLTGECDIENATGQQRSGGTPPPPRRLEKTHHYASAEIGIELWWIDTRFPTRIRVLLGEGTTAEKSKVLSRRFCEKWLCVGIDPTDACDTKYNRRRNDYEKARLVQELIGINEMGMMKINMNGLAIRKKS